MAAVFDATIVKFQPAYDRLMREVRSGSRGRPISYYHAFGMTFAADFPIGETWPERFDPASRAEGGEMTNMGCYAIDQLLAAMETGQPAESDVGTGARGVEVLCAAYRSVLEERPVDLPLQDPRNPLFE